MTDPLHYVCPHCHTTNRVARAQLGNAPDCGSCHQPLVTGKPVALDAASFAKHVGRSQVPVVVDFWAPWCGPCRSMAPAFEQAAAALAPEVQLAKLDTEAHPQAAAPYGIRSIPTMVVFRGGQEIGRISGAMGAGDIQRWVQSVI
ncbi:thioredoxin TrxC [Comamonas endophytica]|uniref:Thioredoxin n=1 Tax=Comamonas endophytica TaxID=2949090 RepID=A0ABY6G7T0_9BURK|nr:MULTISPECIES: thioredoxin TrxC [unclassified Acidovorax]MCD2511061.1 thioredoxin TrxC [Acidovorax sp. D4N7]UYG50467.1 thioredoxin TrxC [Acidovorax sp. 5MLIR]